MKKNLKITHINLKDGKPTLYQVIKDQISDISHNNQENIEIHISSLKITFLEDLLELMKTPNLVSLCIDKVQGWNELNGKDYIKLLNSLKDNKTIEEFKICWSGTHGGHSSNYFKDRTVLKAFENMVVSNNTLKKFTIAADTEGLLYNEIINICKQSNSLEQVQFGDSEKEKIINNFLRNKKIEILEAREAEILEAREALIASNKARMEEETNKKLKIKQKKEDLKTKRKELENKKIVDEKEISFQGLSFKEISEKIKFSNKQPLKDSSTNKNDDLLKSNTNFSMENDDDIMSIGEV